MSPDVSLHSGKREGGLNRLRHARPVLLVPALLLSLVGAAEAKSERLAVTSAVANIRSGPGSGYDILWNAEKNFPLEVIRRSGPWIYFQDFEGDRGWIHQSLVGDVATVITRAPSNPVRAGPGAKEKILVTVESGVPFRVLEQRKEWLHVEHADGDRGWINRSSVW